MKLAITSRANYIVSALTIMAIMPYENGQIATIIPPAWKPYVAAAGVIAKLILDEIKSQQTAEKK